MGDHLVDIISENENVPISDPVPLDIVHNGYPIYDNGVLIGVKGYWHRGSGVLVFRDEKDKIAVFQRRGGNTASGRWCSVGGHNVAGQDHLTTAKKELSEEVFGNSELPDSLKLHPILEFRQMAKWVENRSFGELTPPGRMYHDWEVMRIYKTIYTGDIILNEEHQKVEDMPLDYLRRDIEVNPDSYTDTFKNSIRAYLGIPLEKNEWVDAKIVKIF